MSSKTHVVVRITHPDGSGHSTTTNGYMAAINGVALKFDLPPTARDVLFEDGEVTAPSGSVVETYPCNCGHREWHSHDVR